MISWYNENLYAFYKNDIDLNKYASINPDIMPYPIKYLSIPNENDTSNTSDNNKNCKKIFWYDSVNSGNPFQDFLQEIRKFSVFFEVKNVANQEPEIRISCLCGQHSAIK